MSCPFMSDGCPFKNCKTHDEIVSKMNELKSDDKYKKFFEKLEECPLFKKKCPYNIKNDIEVIKN